MFTQWFNLDSSVCLVKKLAKLWYGEKGFDLETNSMCDILALILKTKFLGLTLKQKLNQSSCFPFKCFVVKSVKQDQVVTKDGDFFL